MPALQIKTFRGRRATACAALFAFVLLRVLGSPAFAADPGSPAPITFKPIDKADILSWPTSWQINDRSKRVTLRRSTPALRVRVLNTDYLADVLVQYMSPFKPKFGHADAHALIDRVLSEEVGALQKASGLSSELATVRDAGFRYFRLLGRGLDIDKGDLVNFIGEVQKGTAHPAENPYRLDPPPPFWSSHMRMAFPATQTLDATHVTLLPDYAVQLLSATGDKIGKSLCVLSPDRLSTIFRKGGQFASIHGVEKCRQSAFRRLRRVTSFIYSYRRMWPDDDFVRWTEDFPEKYLRLSFRGCLASGVGLRVGMSRWRPVNADHPLVNPYSGHLGMQWIERRVEPIDKAWSYAKELYSVPGSRKQKR